MSTPNEFEGPEQAGSQPSDNGHGSPPYQQYQQPKPPNSPSQSGGTSSGQSNNDFKFEMPQDMPHSVKEVLPAGGFASIFKMDGLPQLLKLSYIMWLVAAGIWALVSLALLVTSLIALGTPDDPFGFGAAVRAAGAKGIVVALISMVLTAAMILCAMKLKEGLQWARMALSALALLSIIMMFFGGGGGLLAVVAAVLMWLPESTAWFNTRSGSKQR